MLTCVSVCQKKKNWYVTPLQWIHLCSSNALKSCFRSLCYFTGKVCIFLGLCKSKYLNYLCLTISPKIWVVPRSPTLILIIYPWYILRTETSESLSDCFDCMDWDVLLESQVSNTNTGGRYDRIHALLSRHCYPSKNCTVYVVIQTINPG